MAILSDGHHVAKKRHHCDQCERRIEVGQRYRKQVNTDEGFQTYRAHDDWDLAATEMHTNAKLAYDEYIHLREDAETADKAWISEKYPEVAKRLWPEPVTV